MRMLDQMAQDAGVSKEAMAAALASLRKPNQAMMNAGEALLASKDIEKIFDAMIEAVWFDMDDPGEPTTDDPDAQAALDEQQAAEDDARLSNGSEQVP